MRACAEAISDRRVPLPDGRVLGCSEYGVADGKPVFYFHGYPASRFEARLAEPAAFKLGLRIVALDRPGYGLSDFTPEHRIDGWPDDVAAAARGLGIERFAVLGISGGGPYALACAFRIPERLSAVALVGGLGPVYQPWARRDLRPFARLGVFLARKASRSLWPIYGSVPAQMMRRYPARAYALVTAFAQEADRRVLERPEVREALMASMCEAQRQGPAASLHELGLYARPWGFDLTSIGVPVTLWQGGCDRVVPPAHGHYQSRELPRGRLRLLPEEGHFSLPINRMDEILRDLVRA